jgi:UV DNA damage endonuclease
MSGSAKSIEASRQSALRWGLCCLVVDAPLKFRSATHAYVRTLEPSAASAYVSGIALDNAQSLCDVLQYCARLGIRAFRISSQLFPLATHPESGYTLDTLAEGGEVRRRLQLARELAVANGIRLSLHPDQFVVLNSVRPEVVNSAIGELGWQAEIATAVGADVLCLHGGSTAGGWDAAVDRLIAGVERLSPTVRSLLALENDDRCFPLVELLPVSLATSVPLVLDAHHHRVIDGGLTLAEATDWALATWDDREPYFHMSSPKAGWSGGDPRPHADFIAPADVPRYWLELGARLTVDVEAKAKERAVLRLIEAFPG